jgi:hypothetical protein
VTGSVANEESAATRWVVSFPCRGAVRADRDHTLCLRCYRALRDRVRARLLAQAA